MNLQELRDEEIEISSLAQKIIDLTDEPISVDNLTKIQELAYEIYNLTAQGA